MTHALVTWTPAATCNPTTVRNAVLKAVIPEGQHLGPVRFIDRTALVPVDEGLSLQRLRESVRAVADAHPGTLVRVEPAESAGKAASRFYRPPSGRDEVPFAPTVLDEAGGASRRLRLLADA